jgi:hypothetical protein
LEKLPFESSCRWKYTFDLTGDVVLNFPLRLELLPLMANGGNTLGLPSATEILFLSLPVLDKNNSPKAVDNCVDGRERPKQKPAREPKRGGK